MINKCSFVLTIFVNFDLVESFSKVHCTEMSDRTLTSAIDKVIYSGQRVSVWQNALVKLVKVYAQSDFCLT